MGKGTVALMMTLLVVGGQADPTLDNAKNFILGYFTGFQGSTYNLTNSCLSPSVQTQLYSDWDGIFSSHSIIESLLHLESDAMTAADDCLLWVFPVSVIASFEDKGLDTVKDFIEHFGTILVDLVYAIDQFGEDFFESGRYFGTALGEFLEKVPVEARRKLLAGKLSGFKPNYLDGLQNFTVGLIHGLQANTTGNSVCLTSFDTIASNMVAMGDVAFRCALLDMDSCADLGTALENVLMVLVSFSTNCQFSKLWTKFGGLLTLDGWISLYKNMYWYQAQIRQDYSNTVAEFKAGQYYSAGLNLGQIIQLAFTFTVK